MPRKRHKPEEIVAKLRQVDVMTAQGHSVADAVRSIGVSLVITVVILHVSTGVSLAGMEVRLMRMKSLSLNFAQRFSAPSWVLSRPLVTLIISAPGWKS